MKINESKPTTLCFTKQTNSGSLQASQPHHISLLAMASLTKFSYRRLRQDGWFDEEAVEESVFRRIRNFSRRRKFTIRRRLKLRIPGLRRFLRRRAKFLCKVKVSWAKAFKRLKNGQAHLNDLFGGNFLVMQANLTPFQCGEIPFKGHGLPGLPTRYTL